MPRISQPPFLSKRPRKLSWDVHKSRENKQSWFVFSGEDGWHWLRGCGACLVSAKPLNLGSVGLYPTCTPSPHLTPPPKKEKKIPLGSGQREARPLLLCLVRLS
ncbi:hypothetical protein BDFG_01463 [Blastomyces dermatitidis ATCC 26199]|nr:hypothetical protein BDFG_01463 [Blastomyces dermatitidis ATCC 26199]